MNVIFQSSPWWGLVCLLVGAAYAAALYQPLPGQTSPWSRAVRYGLAAVRFVAVSLLCFLLLNPLVRSVDTRTEKPTVVLAIDNSESMLAAGRPVLNQALTGLQTLRRQLAERGFDVAVRTLADTTSVADDLTQTTFTGRRTDLSALLAGIRSDYEGRHLTDVVLLTDGIANQGLSPTFGQYPFAVQAVGVGDTLPKKDVQLRAAVANRIAYLGNGFPVRAEVVSNGFAAATVVLRQGSRELARQLVRFGPRDAFRQVTFQATATQKGVQRYVVEVLPQPGEFSPRNNRQDVFIDVIDGREKILILALAPHPDVKALRAILERNEQYELDVRVLTDPDAGPLPDKPYDLVILHQVPDNTGLGSAVVQRVLARNTPALFVLGGQSATGAFNTLNPVLQVSAQGGQIDKTTARANPDFRQLTIDPARLEIFDRLPPLSVPYGDYRLQPGSEVVLWQQVGSVRTTKPLLVLNVAGERKAAVLAGEGLWQWRLEEFALTDKQDVVDELIQKTLQLITVREDRRKLRVYPVRNEFVAGETVAFETEQYNTIYERIYNQPVRLELTDEQGLTRTYAYTPTPASGRFEISRLPQGVYRFRASATLNGRAEQATGQVVVRDLQLEAINTTADFALLRQLARQTGGRFYNVANTNSLIRDLTARETPARLSSTEQLDELINWRWLFFLILTLAAAEWGLRKYFGGY